MTLIYKDIIIKIQVDQIKLNKVKLLNSRYKLHIIIK